MSNLEFLPRSPSHGHFDAELNDPREAPPIDHFVPSVSEDFYMNNDHILTQPMSDVDEGLPLHRIEQPSLDADTYEQALSPSTFNHTFLTPEYSSENQFTDPSVPTSPSWEDSWWDQPETSFEPVVLKKDDAESPNPLAVNDAAPMSNQHQTSKAVSEPYSSSKPPQLISPQLTNTPSPLGQHIQSFNMDPKSVSLGSTAQGGLEGNSTQPPDLQVVHDHNLANYDSSIHGLTPSPSRALHPMPSPILRVSTYIRGDSPARSEFRRPRSSSKRSRTSLSSNFLAPTNHYSSEEDEEEKDEEEEYKLQLKQPLQSSSRVTRSKDGSWLPTSRGVPTGLDPTTRDNEHTPSLKEIEEQRQLREKHAEVSSWLHKSEASSELEEDSEAGVHPRGRRSTRPKPRAHSTGARTGTLKLGVFDDSNIPGPGVLLDENSEAAYSEDTASRFSTEFTPVSPPADVGVSFDDGPDYFPPMENVAPEQEEPLPQQFVRPQPWQDVLRGSILHGVNHQPTTSNAAMYKYDQLATKWETASRAATWGTRRRLSDTDIQSILSGQSVRKLSIVQKTRQRGNSIVKHATRFIPRRGSSNAKKTDLDVERDNPSTESVPKDRTDTASGLMSLQRIPSIGKAPKSAPLNTGGAILAMTSPLAAFGRSSSATPDTGTFTSNPWKAVKRQRSKSEVPRIRSSGTLGLAELMTNHGGPPMPTLVSPMHERSSTEEPARPALADEGEDDDDGEEVSADQGIRIDLRVKIDNIVPNPDGFRTHARQLNPRLEQFLIDRIVQEQVRRYKKLAENKVKHTHAVKNLKQCSSISFCFDLGGEAKDLPPRAGTRDPEAGGAQFQIAANGESDGELNTFAEGIVTAALFPAGIPLPPVKKLPAEFECSLCFQVKKFQKPSDWTKHVHEDVQPFTCTFPDCSEARSFKRKADWVRHENERHRHLEWWQCNIADCNHRCYRKDNFVQHLVREHKKREPKVKSRNSISSKVQSEVDCVAAWQAQVQDAEIEQVWILVDACHFETQKKPRDEVCKFCGNVCNSWKKLTVHLAKHMEQIAMPVLELVKLREVSPDTITSPVEQSNRRQRVPNQAISEETLKVESNGLSPYAMNNTPHHAGSPSMPSPSSYSHDSHYTHSVRNSPSFSNTPVSPYDQPSGMRPPDMAQFAQMHNLPPNMSYGPYQNARPPSSLLPMNTPTPAASTYPPLFNTVRRSPQPMVPNASRSHPGFVHINTMYGVQTPQQPIYSSPTDAGPYPAHFDIDMHPVHHYTTGAVAYDQNSVSTGVVVPTNLLFDPHQNPHQGPPFLANQSNGQTQSYGYAPQ